MGNKLMAIVAADVENTLTSGSAANGVVRYFLRHGRAPRIMWLAVKRSPGFVLTLLRLRDKQDYGNQWLMDIATLFKGLRWDEVEAVAIWVLLHELWPKRYKHVIAELMECQRSGRQIILNSGMYQPILDKLAEYLGTTKAIGTPLEMVADRATGQLAGKINKADVKVERMQPQLMGEPVELAYSNGIEDLPMLNLGQSAVIVNPNDKLRKIAQERGWRIVTDSVQQDQKQSR